MSLLRIVKQCLRQQCDHTESRRLMEHVEDISTTFTSDDSFTVVLSPRRYPQGGAVILSERRSE